MNWNNKITTFVTIAVVMFTTTTATAENFSEYAMQRLFTTPDTRQDLDALRSNINPVNQMAPSSTASRVRIDGVMKRSGGKNVVWVNGVSTLDNNSVNGVIVYTDAIEEGSTKIPMRVKDKVIKLAPGQTWSQETGKISDNL